MENKLVSETNVAKWYTNSFTESLTEYLHVDERAELNDRDEVVFLDYICYLVEFKNTNKKEYVVVDNKNLTVIYSSKNFEAVCCWIDAIRLNKILK